MIQSSRGSRKRPSFIRVLNVCGTRKTKLLMTSGKRTGPHLLPKSIISNRIPNMSCEPTFQIQNERYLGVRPTTYEFINFLLFSRVVFGEVKGDKNIVFYHFSGGSCLHTSLHLTLTTSTLKILKIRVSFILSVNSTSCR